MNNRVKCRLLIAAASPEGRVDGRRRVGVDVVLARAHGRAFGPRDPHRCGELGLAAGTVEEHHQPAGDGLGDVGAVVVLDQRQGEVDAGGDAGGGPHVPVAGVDRIGIDLQRRVLVGQLLGPGPVGGDRPAVEQPGLGGEERAAAHGGDSRLRRAAVRIQSISAGSCRAVWRRRRRVSAACRSRPSRRQRAVTICSPLSVVIGVPCAETIDRS